MGLRRHRGWLLVALLWPRAVEAVPAATGQQCNAAAGATTVSCTVSVTSGNTVFMIALADLAAGIGADATAAGCADDQGNVYKPAVRTKNTGGSGVKICTSVLTHTASTTFTFTGQNGSADLGISVIEFSGLVTATPSLDQNAFANTSGSNQASATTLTTTTADQVVIAALDTRGSGTFACGAGYTQISEDETWVHVAYSACYKVVSATGTQQTTWTSPAAAGASVIATFSATTTGNTGSAVRWSGHSCSTLTITAASVASVSCNMAYASGSIVVLVGTAQGSRIGTTDNAGCSDSDSNTYTYGIMHNSAAGYGIKFCYFIASAAGQASFLWTNQGGTSSASVAAFEIFGGKQSSPLDQTALNDSGAGTSANPTTGTTSATAQAVEFIATGLLDDTNGPYTCGAGYTSLDNYSTCFKVTSSTGTQAMTYTVASGTWQAGIVAFLGAPTSGAGLLPWLAE